MSIVSITLVKNEEQMIESFVRYNSLFIDRMVIIDNGCKDNTIPILRKLIAEGFNIELYTEASTGYKQLYLENKYMYKAIKSGNESWVIPLDVDEFLDMDKGALEEVNQEKGYYVYWENYVFDERVDEDESCVVRRLKTKIIPRDVSMISEDFKITKVVLPRKYILDNNVYLAAGHHGITEGGIKKLELLANVNIAHYPIVSRNQLLSKIYGKYIGYITNELRGTNGVHVNRFVDEIENDCLDIAALAAGEYTIGEGNIKLYEKKCSLLRPDISNSIIMRYTDKKDIDIKTFFKNLSEEYALKLAIEKKHGIKDPNKKRILVFGIGNVAKYMFEQVDSEDLEVMAFIDSDTKNRYMRFNKEIIINPEDIKFIEFDYIVLATIDRFEEMKKILLDNGIDENRIVGMDYLYKRMIQKRI